MKWPRVARDFQTQHSGRETSKRRPQSYPAGELAPTPAATTGTGYGYGYGQRLWTATPGVDHRQQVIDIDDIVRVRAVRGRQRKQDITPSGGSACQAQPATPVRGVSS